MSYFRSAQVPYSAAYNTRSLYINDGWFLKSQPNVCPCILSRPIHCPQALVS